MPFYRKLLIIVSSSSFRLLLFFTISIIAGILLYSDKNYVPTILDRNKVYKKIVPSLLETNKEQSITVGGDITLENPEIQKIINEAFPANELQVNANIVIDAVYDWLEQESSTVAFNIDLTANKQRLAEGLSNYAINRLKSLETCTTSVSEIDPFSANCQPSTIDYEAERASIYNQLLNESGFLNNPIITEKTLVGDDESFNEKYSSVPVFYSMARVFPVYIVLILIILALIVIFASSTYKKGINKIGRGLIGAGASLIFFTVVFTFVLPQLTGSLPILQSSGTGIDSVLNQVAIDFGQEYSLMIIKISAPLIVIGSGMVVYARIGKNKKDYKSAKLKSGIISGNEQKKKTSNKKSAKPRPPVQSSESSDTKPKKIKKNKKYRKIPKKEL